MILTSEMIEKELAERKFYDPVNHPSHYTSHPSGVECIDIVRPMTFNIGNVIKYCWRAGLKESPPRMEPTSYSQAVAPVIDPKHIEDLKKARWYLDDEIQRLEKLNVR
jgi:Protein of unknwon function (DUF3310)